eukprot:Rhum_TRINITY_DN14605_c10_g1::Rhum_TRINITY_DN14605_c10_g1_i1::g.103783::m.103783
MAAQPGCGEVGCSASSHKPAIPTWSRRLGKRALHSRAIVYCVFVAWHAALSKRPTGSRFSKPRNCNKRSKGGSGLVEGWHITAAEKDECGRGFVEAPRSFNFTIFFFPFLKRRIFSLKVFLPRLLHVRKPRVGNLVRQDTGGTKVVQRVHDVVDLLRLHHRLHGDPLLVNQLRDGRRLLARRQLGRLGQVVLLDVVDDHAVVLRRDDAVHAARQLLNQLREGGVRVGDEDGLRRHQRVDDLQVVRNHRVAGLDEVDDAVGQAQAARHLHGPADEVDARQVATALLLHTLEELARQLREGRHQTLAQEGLRALVLGGHGGLDAQAALAETELRLHTQVDALLGNHVLARDAQVHEGLRDVARDVRRRQEHEGDGHVRAQRDVQTRLAAVGQADLVQQVDALLVQTALLRHGEQQLVRERAVGAHSAEVLAAGATLQVLRAACFAHCEGSGGCFGSTRGVLLQ